MTFRVFHLPSHDMVHVGGKLYFCKDCKVPIEVRKSGRLVKVMSHERLKAFSRIVARRRSLMLAAMDISSKLGIGVKTAMNYAYVVRKLLDLGLTEVGNSEGDPSDAELPLRPTPRRWPRKLGNHPLCCYHKPCKYQSMSVTSWGKVKHIPYCLWHSTCNMKAWDVGEVAERRSWLCKKFGLRYCPKCLTYHLCRHPSLN